MNRAFLDAYNRELGLLYERSREFAEDYPGIAERLGGLTQTNMDPAIAGLLEGAAFMAARIQLLIDSEFRTFTDEMLDQLLPNLMAPLPSCLMVEADPLFGDANLAKGMRFPAGAYLDARYLDRDQRIACRYRLAAPLEMWPLRLSAAEVVAGAAGLQALGLDVGDTTAGGLRLSFFRPATSDPSKPGGPVSEIRASRLPIHLVGDPSETIALYEHLVAAVSRVTLRYLDERGDPVFLRLDPGQIEQIGFDEDEALFPEDTRVFRGFTLLREFFAFPQKFLGIRLTGLDRVLPRVPAAGFDLLIEMDRLRPSLAARIGTSNFRLFTAPAINLFEENCSQTRLDERRHEFLVIPDSSPASHYEVHRIREVFAYYEDAEAKVPVHPLYAAPPVAGNPREALFFTARQRPRRQPAAERRFGKPQDYTGTETLISIYEPAALDSTERLRRLQIKALCSNRHLPLHLPLAQGGADFRLNDDTRITLRCIAGPTPPRASVPELERDPALRLSAGPVNWRLISYLSLNFLGLDQRAGEGGAAGLREMLMLFTDVTSQISDRQIRGIKGITSRAITRSIRRAGGYHAARGIEVTLTFDERAFEGSGILLMGAVLDRFMAEYAAVNSFTQVVIRSDQRGVVKVWPPRTGQGPLL